VNHTQELVTLTAYWVIFVADLLFIWRLALSDWRQHAWGRNVMAFTVGLEIQIGLILARTIFGDYPGREWAITVFACLFALVVVHRLYIWVRGERQARPRNGGRQ